MASELQFQERPLSRAEALEVAERCAELLKREFGATRVIVFGSAAGQMPWHDQSDLDLAVEGIEPEVFSRAWSAIERLAPLPVDLVDLNRLYPEMRARVLGEAKMPEDTIAALKVLVDDELVTLEHLAARVDKVAGELSGAPSWIEMDSMALNITNFYSTVESIFERIAVQFDGGVPSSAEWHAELFRQMNEHRGGKRAGVIDDQLYSLLDDYRKFRHFVRYGFREEFEWEQIRPKVERLSETLALLRSQLDQFFATVHSTDEK